jgi:CDP-glycerol glycerophosphotransferase (TagB/SpsB family)
LSFFDLIKSADIVVSDVSTTILESLARNVPAIIFFPNISDKIKSTDFPFDLIATNPMTFADDANSLKHLIQTLFTNPNIQLENSSKILDHYLGSRDNLFDQRASNHIAELIASS